MGRSGNTGGRSSGGGGFRSSGGRHSGGASRSGFSGGSGSSGSSRSSGGLFGGLNGGSRSSGGFGGLGGGSRSAGGSGKSSPGSSGSNRSTGGSSFRPPVQKPSGRTGGVGSKPPADGFGTPTRWSAPRPTYTHSRGFGGPGGLFGGEGSPNVQQMNTGGFRPAGSPQVDRGVRGCGCLSAPVLILAVVLIVLLLGFSRCGSLASLSQNQNTHTHNNSSSVTQTITASTIRRTKLESGIVKETGYYTDELGWIGNASTLTKGMRNFYKRTGVQPYLYITDTVLGTHYPSDSQLDEAVGRLYEELFQDEGHLLLLFFEYDSQYTTWYMAGSAAATVIDSEAADILLDYVDRYYYSNLSDEEMFSKAFDEASERMMQITVSPWVYVGVTFLVLVILVVALIWWAIAKKKKKEEEERMQQILNTPLETYADAELKQREEKYSTDETPPSAERKDETQ